MIESPGLPSTARVKRLSREIVPFSSTDLIMGKVPYVSNPDPVLQYVALKDESEYPLMERAEPAIGSAKRKRMNTLFSFGTEVQAGNNSKEALDLKDFAVHLLKNIHKWRTVQRLMYDAIFWGWRPLEAMWQFDLKWRGKPYWAPKEIHEKKNHHFRFTPERELVYVGNGTSDPVVFNRWEDDYHWLVCTAGSTDNPYGEALYRSIWLIYYVKQQFFQLWAQGMKRSVGVIQAKQTVDATSALMGAAAAKSVEEIASDLRQVLRYLDQKNVLVSKYGWVLEMLTDVEFSEAWKQPIDYCDEIITIAITGETLSMRLGDVGSRAAAQVHRDGLIDYCKSDAGEIENFVNDELLTPALTLNFGDIPLDLLPKYRSKIHQVVDVEKASKLYNMGLPVDGERLAAEAGVPIALDDSPSKCILQKPDPMEMAKLAAETTGGAVQGKKEPDPKQKGKNPPAKPPVRADQPMLPFDDEVAEF